MDVYNINDLNQWLDDAVSDDPVRVERARTQYPEVEKDSGGIERIVVQANHERLQQICQVLVQFPMNTMVPALLHRATEPHMGHSLRRNIFDAIRATELGHSGQWLAGIILILLTHVQRVSQSGAERLFISGLITELSTKDDSRLFHYLYYVLDKSPSEAGEAVALAMAKTRNPEAVPLLLNELRRRISWNLAWSSGIGVIHPRAFARALVEIGTDEAIEGCIEILHQATEVGRMDSDIAAELNESDDPRAVNAVKHYRENGA